MTGYLQKTMIILTMAFCLWSGAAVEAGAGILAAAQGSFYPVSETTAPPAQNLVIEESGNLLVVYGADELDKIKDQAKPLSVNPEREYSSASYTWSAKKVFTPRHVPVDVVNAELDKLKSERGKIVVIGNDIYVADYPDAIAAMTQAFMRLEHVSIQVLIEARIIECPADFLESLSLEWNAAQTHAPLTSAEATGGTISASHRAALAFGFLSKTTPRIVDARITMNAVCRTLSAPRIMAENDKEVTIKQGPARECCAGRPSSDADCAAHCRKYDNFYMDMRVSPHIGEKGQEVTLSVKIITDASESATPGAESSPTSKEAQTRLTLRDGETVVIGGLMMSERLDSENRILGMSGLPLSDWLPINRSNDDPRPEILILITANIIPVEN